MEENETENEKEMRGSFAISLTSLNQEIRYVKMEEYVKKDDEKLV